MSKSCNLYTPFYKSIRHKLGNKIKTEKPINFRAKEKENTYKYNGTREIKGKFICVHI